MSPSAATKPDPRDASSPDVLRSAAKIEVVTDQLAQDEALLAFDAERASGSPVAPKKDRSPSKALRLTLIVGATLALAGLATLAGVRNWWPFRAGSPQSAPTAGLTVAPPAPPPPVAATEGTATISSRPEGAQILVDGVVRGVTPMKLSLPLGNHTLELVNAGARRVLPLAIEAGTVASHYVDLAPGAGAPGVQTGRLEVLSEPAGARVTVDGTPRGETPLVLPAVAVGQHTVVVTQGESRVVRTVTVTPGGSASVLASMAAAGPAAGWVSFTSALELQIFEEGRLLGTTGTGQILLPAGRHALELVSAPYDFRTTMIMQVQTGRTATATVPIPTGSLSVNAQPWAEVFLDGQSVGTTPLANLSVTIGPHELVWRHPQLGERRQSIAVTTKAPLRVGVDLRK